MSTLICKEFLDSTPHEYVLSVPAVWSDMAKDRTLKCALGAGFGDKSNASSIKLVLEPEAAAVYTITTVSSLLAIHSSLCSLALSYRIVP